MRKQKLLIFSLLFLICVIPKTYSQTITANPMQGCIGTNVFFTGVSGATSHNWDFGNGTGTSTLSNPSSQYNNPNTYTITYSATVNSTLFTAALTITIYPNPSGTLNYILPSNHCAPMTVSFTASGAPAGSAYSIVFGDAAAGVGASQTHVYGYKGSFIPKLVVTNSVGCASSAIGNGTINVSNPPVMQIAANPGTFTCTAPFTTAFNATASVSGSPTGNNSLSYFWNFGNGSPSSNSPSPNAVTYALGQYTVSLTGTDDNFCSSTATTVVLVVQPSLAVTLPSVVCVEVPFMVTVSSNQTLTLWNMGNGNTADFLVNPSAPTSGTVYAYPFGSGGTKTITISTPPFATCPAITVTKTVMVEEIVADFTLSPSSPSASCSSPMLAPLINLSTVNTNAALSYSWVVPSGLPAYNIITPLTSTATNPTFTLTQGSQNPYTVYDQFVPSIQLWVTSANGCVMIATHAYHYLQRPSAFFHKTKREGCAPLAVTFRDSSEVMFDPNISFAITSYTWNSGTNPPVLQTGNTSGPTFSVPPFSYTYTASGTYTPFLTIQTAGGCSDVSFIDTVIVSPGQANISLSVPFSTVCAGAPVTLTMQAAPGQTVQHWHVTTDNGFFSGCVNNSMPTYSFTHPGTHNFTVSASQFGCNSASVFTTPNITVYGPYSQFRYETNCANTSSVKFYSYLQDVQTATLNFGDGSSQTLVGNAGSVASIISTHVYTVSSGDFTVTLVSENTTNACAQQTYSQVVRVRHAQAQIRDSTGQPLPALPNAYVCKGSQVKFSGAGSTDVASLCYGSNYSWFFYSPNPTDTMRVGYGKDTVANKFLTAGIHTVTLRVADINGCQSTDTKLFRVSGVTPNFTFAANPICLTDSMRLINLTTQVAPDAIATYSWNFGDGNSTVVTTSTISPYLYNPNYNLYNPPGGTLSVVLTATNTLGCSDKTTHTIIVNNPSAVFNTSKPLGVVCVPEQLNITVTNTTNIITYSVNYIDAGNVVTQTYGTNIFSHLYSAPGNDTIKVTVIDASGCRNTQVRAIKARVRPTASFLFDIDCATGIATFTSTSTTTDPVYSPINLYNWSWASGSNISTVPGATIQFPFGISTVSLFAIPDSLSACASVPATQTLHLYDLKADFVLNKTKFCLGQAIVAGIQNTQDVQSWQCNVGFGIQPSPTPMAPTQSVTHTYNSTAQSGTVFVRAVIYSPDSNCRIVKETLIEIINLNRSFTRNLEQTLVDTVHCARIPDKFTYGANSTTVPATYSWQFGDGNTSSDSIAVHTYSTAGVFPVKYTVQVPSVGCSATSTKNMTILPLPSATVTSGDNCSGKPFVIDIQTTNGVISGTWSPAANMVSSPVFTTDAASFTVSAVALATTDFSLQVTDVNNCVSDMVVKNIYIIQPPPHIKWDTTIVVGQTVALSGYLGADYSYQWTPLTANLSCTNCANPVSTTTNNATYSVMITDYLHCDTVTNIYKIIVEPKTSVDVPTAFTPNGDGVNDVVYVNGWGIKKLNYFRIYNRWGQLLFETNDINEGWNGIFNGVPQNMETYVYQVSADTYLDKEPVLKSGTIKLIR